MPRQGSPGKTCDMYMNLATDKRYKGNNLCKTSDNTELRLKNLKKAGVVPSESVLAATVTKSVTSAEFSITSSRLQRAFSGWPTLSIEKNNTPLKENVLCRAYPADEPYAYAQELNITEFEDVGNVGVTPLIFETRLQKQSKRTEISLWNKI